MTSIRRLKETHDTAAADYVADGRNVKHCSVTAVSVSRSEPMSRNLSLHQSNDVGEARKQVIATARVLLPRLALDYQMSASITRRIRYLPRSALHASASFFTAVLCVKTAERIRLVLGRRRSYASLALYYKGVQPLPQKDNATPVRPTLVLHC